MDAYYIRQSILPSHDRVTIPMSRFSPHLFSSAVSSIVNADAAILGISIRLSALGQVDAIALATPDEVFYISLHTPSGSIRSNLISMLLTALGTKTTFAGFLMHRIALHLYRCHHWSIRGVDLSGLRMNSAVKPTSPAEFLCKYVDPDVKRREVDCLWYQDPEHDEEEARRRVCLRAWVTAVCASTSITLAQAASPVNLRNLFTRELDCLAKLVHIAEQLEAQKPTSYENEFRAVTVGTEGGIVLENDRFKTRIRRSEQTSILFETESGRKFVGQAVKANGKNTTLHIIQGTYQHDIARVSVHGREELTNAENARDSFVLRVLQGDLVLRLQGLDSARRPYLLDSIWFPVSGAGFTVKSRSVHARGISIQPPLFRNLNESQREVAVAMISGSEPLVIAHGPPGTGKTSTIAAAVEYWIPQSEHVWIVAQSNVGVKNIARSLFSKGITNFKLIVSKEFYYEWHEELYEDIEGNLIRSDDISQVKDAYEAERFLGESTIILCTLGMLSNPVLEQARIFQINPVKKLVVDEASQINVFEFMHLLHKFKDLDQLSFFGDPKQLPPYGQDTVSDLQSIFDIKHLKPTAFFLNTQYRMPVPLGDFISREVYNSKLKSSHQTRDPSCIAFIDVSKGQEESCGKSWKNTAEAQLVVTLIRDYYRHKDYCVITPYDAQRAEIRRQLESAGVPSDHVFNVDSFQGHEAKYVIVSAVRTTRPGFLSVQSRTNVMLTRCKAGMVLVTNKGFLAYHAEKTLMYKLAAEWTGLGATGDGAWVDWRRVTENTANLPGAPGPRALRPLNVAPPVTAAVPEWRKQSLGASLFAPVKDVNALHQAMGRLQFTATPSSRPPRRILDEFPALGGPQSTSKQNLEGSWRKGSAAIRK